MNSVSATWSDGSKEVCHDCERSDAHTTECGCNRDVFLQLVQKAGLSVAWKHHVLVLELLQDVLGCASTDLDPGLREQGASGQDEGDVENGVEGIWVDLKELPWGRDVIGQSSNWDTASSHFEVLPLPEKLDQEVASEPLVEQLGEEIEVGDKSGLEDDWDVGSVEQFDRVGRVMSADFGVFDCEVNSETLKKINKRWEEVFGWVLLGSR